MEEHKVIANDGRVLWAAELGRGEPLVLCHGGPGLWDMSAGLAELPANRVRVIRWDQRGGGRSEREGPYTMARTLADLDAVRVHFGLSRTALLGHSWGADVALHYALAHPDRVSSLVYVSGTGLGHAWHEQYRRNLTERPGGDRTPAAVGGGLPGRRAAGRGTGGAARRGPRAVGRVARLVRVGRARAPGAVTEEGARAGPCGRSGAALRTNDMTESDRTEA